MFPFRMLTIAVLAIGLVHPFEATAQDSSALAERLQSLERRLAAVEAKSRKVSFGIVDTWKVSSGSDQTLQKKVFKLSEVGILFISAWARGAAQATPPVNAGIRLTITVNNDQCANDYSFEGQTSFLTFTASGACAIPLSPGKHTVVVEREETRITSHRYLDLDAVLVAAK